MHAHTGTHVLAYSCKQACHSTHVSPSPLNASTRPPAARAQGRGFHPEAPDEPQALASEASRDCTLWRGFSTTPAAGLANTRLVLPSHDTLAMGVTLPRVREVHVFVHMCPCVFCVCVSVCEHICMCVCMCACVVRCASLFEAIMLLLLLLLPLRQVTQIWCWACACKRICAQEFVLVRVG